tara:strand:- start:1189 stop:1587 length:399 start_codon:yes stop_codon:yes gene_type:complete
MGGFTRVTAGFAIVAALGGCAAGPSTIAWQPWPEADSMIVATDSGPAEVRARYAGLMAVEIQAAPEPRQDPLSLLGIDTPADVAHAVDVIAIVYCGRDGVRPERSSVQGTIMLARYDCRVNQPARPPRRPER